MKNFVLARGNMDRDEVTRNDPEALGLARKSEQARYILVEGQSVAVNRSKQNELLKLTAQEAREWNSREAVYLGRIENVPYFACDISDMLPDTDVKPAGTPVMRPVKLWAHEWSGNDSILAVTAVAIHNWIRSSRYCSNCGEPLAIHPSGWQAYCENNHLHFPRTDPAVIMAVRDNEDRLLLARNPQWYGNMYSVLAGFVEAGETAESAVVRESFEETRVNVNKVEYFGSQPWPFPRSLMLAFNAWTSSTDDDIMIDGNEMSDAQFFSRDELKKALRHGKLTLPSPSSVARALIEDWLGQTVEEVMEG
ncbi:MAG: NAD(+) diphosphatase [Actinomycetaceae bacterium]|nr:NAD(+) diphosphatase [Actinomycetaceae bacterium]